MSDINSTSQPMSELFKEQNIPQAEIKQSLFSKLKVKSNLSKYPDYSTKPINKIRTKLLNHVIKLNF